MQEQINEKAVALTVSGTKLTARLLAKAMAAALRQMRNNRMNPKMGSQSMKRLTRNDDATSTIEVMGRIKSFEPFARKYRVSYHAEKDTSVTPPKYTVYFKSKQADAITSAFTAFSKKTLKKDRPSVLATLKKMKERVQNQTKDRVKNRTHGGHEL